MRLLNQLPMNDAAPRARSARCRVVLGLLVSGGCLAWAVFSISRDRPLSQTVGELGAAFRTADLRTLPVFWCGLFAFYVLKAWRWRLLLSPLGTYRPLRDLFPPMMIGFGVQVPLAASAIVAAVLAVGVALPSSPGYIGVVQVCFLAVLKPFVEAEEAVFAASIYYHAAQYIPVTAAGLWYWNRIGMSELAVPLEAGEETPTLAGDDPAPDGGTAEVFTQPSVVHLKQTQSLPS